MIEIYQMKILVFAMFFFDFTKEQQSEGGGVT